MERGVGKFQSRKAITQLLISSSRMYIGTAARMAGWLKLHVESTYRLPTAATFEQVIEQEVARRTFWLMHYHECHMLTGSQRPSSFQLSEIDALLPMDEDDFAFGQEPSERAALAGTAAAQARPAAVATPSRSLFVGTACSAF